ncbi:MAG: tRNA 2-thiouridine(34) synthase MnmA [Anaerolineales bacterium]|nr:tRNA 2-thiouridine(34) synthase MnmA [Anaerolineales bacterium]
MARRRIAVAMSGGVDSSVAALRLVNAGEDVFGVMLRLWNHGPEQENRCCTPRDLANARSIAADLNIPFYVLDAKDRFKSEVVDTFIDGYAQGMTPNPCIACNQRIRWGYLLRRSMAMGATHLATGHYAIVEKLNGQRRLCRAVDRSKDQSYVLHMLNQEQLSRAIFPLGNLHKTDVRAYAAKHDLSVADREDSQDLCFLGQMDYRSFLDLQQIPFMDPGPIVDTRGTIIGEHHGLASYTIGQRKGIEIPAREPFYVISKDLSRNALIVGHREDLGRRQFSVGKLNWIQGAAPLDVNTLSVQVRYKASPVQATISKSLHNRVEVHLSESLADITPGQWAVFYDGDICLGGGMILP